MRERFRNERDGLDADLYRLIGESLADSGDHAGARRAFIEAKESLADALGAAKEKHASNEAEIHDLSQRINHTKKAQIRFAHALGEFASVQARIKPKAQRESLAKPTLELLLAAVEFGGLLGIKDSKSVVVRLEKEARKFGL